MNAHIVGTWINLDPSQYRRLVAIARRCLVGHEHHAEDAVSRAVVRWLSIPGARQSVARIEQVVKSEAHSILRSERRTKAREERYERDRSRARCADSASSSFEERALRASLRRVAAANRITLTPFDARVLDLLLAGCSAADAGRRLGVGRHRVRQSRDKWRRVVELSADADRRTDRDG